MDSKQKYGQFMTTNYKHILQNLNIPENTTKIIEPFVGQGHLLNFINDINVESYDIDPQIENCSKQDTLLNPLDYTDTFVLTNPPYLARNKNPDKTLYDKYNTNDLYKCFIKQLINTPCQGGILIIPLNFFCSSRGDSDEFLKMYSIVHLNVFEEQVFKDTTYTICSFQFVLSAPETSIDKYFPTTFYPTGETKIIDFDFDLGLEKNNDVKVMRLTRENMERKNTSMLLHCIDSKNNEKIRMVFENEAYVDKTPKLSARSFATIIIEPAISVDRQRSLVVEFNQYLNDKRSQHHSLFLTNYRDFGRKRISFDLAYKIIKHLLKK